MTTRQITFFLPNYIVQSADGGWLLGDFNNWNHDRAIALQKNEYGDMHVTIELISGQEYEYRYLLSDGRWVNDDKADYYKQTAVPGEENCVIMVSAAAEYESEHRDMEATPAAKPVAKTKKVAAPKEDKKKIIREKVDFTVLYGVSKQASGLLHQKGITTFSLLGKTTIKALKEILEEAGEKYEKINPATWPKQAKAMVAKKNAEKKPRA